MFSRTALARAFALPSEQPFLSTTFRACLHQATTTASSTSTVSPDSPLSAKPRAQSSTPTRQSPPARKQPAAPRFAAPVKVTKSLLEMLPHLTSQKPHYITAHLHARPFLVTAGDHIRLPFLMPNVKPGDILRFNRASVLGSRDFTLKGAPYIDERLFECRVRVMGVDAEPLRIKEKTKRRNRHVQKVKSKHKYTLLRVMDVKVKTAEELLQEGAVVVEGDAEHQVEVKA
ncbi:mitochondrial 54S ribosomal protein bL21m [Aspergillus clavatus NRRL 1]|uniref:Large ribosomal subunit protein bL21m n=1 Tax=Aspergillus clavatus (strain ATCC 1007 / CBS 513.65 / DSM 816 / NCTC 3887 / NRRL 1 / QM 1276 / 107) TaxID=344612 RepID=A1CJS7_ASPCL|nr:aconitate hydratase, putative [Aspergillus clavatus NRRL 1]EAW09401.1 aconitate hydratase, putative [Aspergillus clavatus NRRL 1]